MTVQEWLAGLSRAVGCPCVVVSELRAALDILYWSFVLPLIYSLLIDSLLYWSFVLPLIYPHFVLELRAALNLFPVD